MFREKDRMLKIKRLIKKCNINKDKIINKKSYIMYDHGFLKTKQQILKKRFNIKIHMNDLRNYKSYKSDDSILGNSTVGEIKEAMCKIKEKELPFKNQYTHDITRWKSSKSKSKEKNNRRKTKLFNQNM